MDLIKLKLGRKNGNKKYKDDGLRFDISACNNDTDNERLNKNLKREEVDWTQSRVVFVSTSFTEYQIQATNF